MASIIKPLRSHLVLMLSFFGLFAIFFGAVAGSWFDTLPYIPQGSGEAILKIGSAVLGAGIFAATVKSSQFVEIFQNHLHDVIYKPIETFGLQDLKQKWISITKKILEKTLPNSHSDVSNRIMKQFLTSELHYHFSDFKAKYDITVEPQSNNAIIIHTINTKIVISPNQENPCFKQELLVEDGNCELLSLIINREPISVDQAKKDFLSNPDNNKRQLAFNMPLNQYIKQNAQNSNKIVELERTYKITQNLSSEPFLMVTIKRFVSGYFEVKAKIEVKEKIGSGYKFSFTKIGLEDAVKKPLIHHKDAEGFYRWTLSEANDVLLPGQGFILMILPNDSCGVSHARQLPACQAS